MTLDDFAELFSLEHILELLTSSFDSIFDFLSKFFLESFTSLKNSYISTGDTVLSTFFNLFSSDDISNFILIFVGFVFILFLIKATFYIIRG